MATENWKPVFGYEGLYEISDQNRVVSLERVVRMREYTRTIPRRMLTVTPQNNAYLRVNLAKQGISRSYYVHKLVENAFGIEFTRTTKYKPTASKPKNNGIMNLLSAWG